MEEKKVCDYFVIAGLPNTTKRVKQNAFGLADNNLSSPQNKKNLSYSQNSDSIQPITNITIINKTENEHKPFGYDIIDKTPSGHSANLNNGSINSPEIFICFKRGLDRPPITDIGVFYESKDELMQDSIMVSKTFYGSCGNINNSNSKTYLTYRQSNQNAPCNQLVVTDICVIITNKGEIPPLTYKIINRNLNKGFLGNDVFICYKKSMNTPSLIRYTPCIIDRFPKEELDSYSLPESIAMFCLPLGSTIECIYKENFKVRPVLSTFVLTSNSAAKVYGVALTFYENFPIEELETLSNEDLKKLGYFSGSDQLKKKLLVNKSICILSRWPFFDLFEGVLRFLHKILFNSFKKPLNLPIEAYISHFMMNIPFPSIHRPKIRIQLSACEDEKLILSNPFEETPLPLSGAKFSTFLINLGVENCMHVFFLALIEQKILLHSLNLDVITSVAEAITSLIFPFHWQCPYIPLCPLALCDVLNAPLPFIVGVDSRYFDLYVSPNDVTCVDLDTSSIYTSEEKKNISIKLAPRKAYKNLKRSLEFIYEKFTLEFVKIQKTKNKNSSLILNKQFENEMNLEIREAFLQFMTYILKDFRSYLLPIKNHPSVNSTDPNALFNFYKFLQSKEKNSHFFYENLISTQMFTRFIEERTFVSDKYTSLAFFDECLNKLESCTEINFSSFRLIELDERDKNDRTVFISDPESLINSKKDNFYEYKKFGPFNHEFFLKEPILCHIDDRKFSFESKFIENISSDNYSLSMNSNIMIKRTKQEMRTAQRITQRLAETPLTWSKCLISYCYSLWFVHLQSYIKFTQNISVKGKLKIAFKILKRMQSLNLHPLDEVCYRILIFLSGKYSQPVLAIKILSEMKSFNVTPNAITYGYYSKAVLENEYSTNEDSLNENAHWKKLRILIDCIAEFKRSGKKYANNYFKEKKNLLLNNKNDSFFSRQTFKTSSLKEKKFDKNYASFNDEIKSTIIKTNSNCQKVLIDYSNSAGLLINSQIYQDQVCIEKKAIVRIRHKSESHDKKTLILTKKASQKSEFQKNLLRSQSLSEYKKNELDKFFTVNFKNNYVIDKKCKSYFESNNPEKIIEECYLEKSDSQNELKIDKNKKIETSTEETSESTNKSNDNSNLQSTESLNSETNFSPFKDAFMNMGIFSSEKVASTLRSSFRLAKNQLAGNSLFRTSLIKQASSPLDLKKNLSKKSETPQSNSKNNLEKIDSSIENLDFKENDENKLSMTRSSTLPLVINAVDENNEKSKNSNYDETDNIENNGMIKSFSTDLNSIWSSKFSSNKHMDYFNSTLKFANSMANRFNDLKSTLSTSNNNSPLKPNQNQSALLANIGQNTSALLTNFATKFVEKIPSNVGPFSEFNDGYSFMSDFSDNTSSDSKKQNEFFDTIDQHYSIDVEYLNQLKPILKIEMTSCNKCYNCLAILYDEEIMGEWSPDNSNLNTACRYCEKLFVPQLTITINYDSSLNEDKNLISFETDSNSQGTTNLSDETIQYIFYKKFSMTYLSPIVLRKELESIVENEGDFCLTNIDFLNNHAIIYWNLLWYFNRTNLPTHLTGLYLLEFLSEKNIPLDINYDYRNVEVECFWDDENLFDDIPKPIYHFWKASYNEKNETTSSINEIVSETISSDKYFFNKLLENILNENLVEAIRIILISQNRDMKNERYFFSIYRDLLYFLLTAVDRKNIDNVAFDREYRHAYDSLTSEDASSMRKTDKPPSLKATFCRRCFKSLNLKNKKSDI